MKRREYLWRLTLVVLLGLLLPAMIGFAVFRQYALSGWEKTNENSYRTDVSEWGIYLYDSGRIVTAHYSYQLDDFLYKYTGVKGAAS